jgi:hypothetical protein
VHTTRIRHARFSDSPWATRDSIHDYNTLQSRSQQRRVESASPSGSRALPTSSLPRTPVCATQVSMSSGVLPVRSSYWLPSLALNKRQHCSDVAPANAVVGKKSLMPAMCHCQTGVNLRARAAQTRVLGFISTPGIVPKYSPNEFKPAGIMAVNCLDREISCPTRSSWVESGSRNTVAHLGFKKTSKVML